MPSDVLSIAIQAVEEMFNVPNYKFDECLVLWDYEGEESEYPFTCAAVDCKYKGKKAK